MQFIALRCGVIATTIGQPVDTCVVFVYCWRVVLFGLVRATNRAEQCARAASWVTAILRDTRETVHGCVLSSAECVDAGV